MTFHIARQQLDHVECDDCGDEFKAAGAWQRFCWDCWNRRQQDPAECEFCGNEVGEPWHTLCPECFAEEQGWAS